MLGIAFFNGNLLKAEEYIMTESEIQEFFEGLSDEQLVVSYPDGAISYTSDVLNDYTEEELEQFNARIQTVAEVKEEYRHTSFVYEDPFIFYSLRIANPAGSHAKVMKSGEHYSSRHFSGKGWQFSGYRFYPQQGTGAYLYFRSLKDDGRVGNYSQMMNTYMGYGIGGDALMQRDGWRLIFVGASITNENNAKGYFTYNPVAGTTYEVHN